MTDVLDSQLLQNNFSTAAMRIIWSDQNKITQQLKVEAALSKIEGQLGVIPQTAAKKIVQSAKIENFRIEELAKQSAEKRHSLIALIDHLQVLAGTQLGGNMCIMAQRPRILLILGLCYRSNRHMNCCKNIVFNF
nr:hypothetical protein [Liquorilactobacillus satsumensis]